MLTYCVRWENGAGMPLLEQSRGYPVHWCAPGAARGTPCPPRLSPLRDHGHTRALCENYPGKEVRPVGGVNRVLLVGPISKYGVTLKYATSGAACASFTLVLVEVG